MIGVRCGEGWSVEGDEAGAAGEDTWGPAGLGEALRLLMREVERQHRLLNRRQCDLPGLMF